MEEEEEEGGYRKGNQLGARRHSRPYCAIPCHYPTRVQPKLYQRTSALGGSLCFRFVSSQPALDKDCGVAYKRTENICFRLYLVLRSHTISPKCLIKKRYHHTTIYINQKDRQQYLKSLSWDFFRFKDIIAVMSWQCYTYTGADQ